MIHFKLLPQLLELFTKPSLSRGAPSWVPNVLTYGGEVIEY